VKMSDNLLVISYQLFFALLAINLVIYLTFSVKPKFIYRRSRIQKREIVIPLWIQRLSLINLMLSCFFLGIISYFVKLMNSLIAL
jgi:hypothetical protein